LIELLLAIVLPTVIGLFFLSDSVLLLLYGNDHFLPASVVLHITVWNLIQMVITSVFSQMLMASQHEKVTLQIIVIDALVILVSGTILISQFSLIGAAITVVLAGIADFFQHYISVSRLLFKIELHKLIWRPILAGLCMAIYLTLARNQEVLLTAVFSSILYVGALLVLTIWSTGGPHQLKARYLYLKSEERFWS
jgi:O-antigen/teichoic acid export membrane protein